MKAAQKKQAVRDDIAQAREQQRKDKARLMAEMALQEREEYASILATQKRKNEADAAIANEKQLVRVAHRDEILEQINIRAEAKEQVCVLLIDSLGS